MRTTLRNSAEVFHVWAQHTQREGRTRTSNVSFRNGHLFSYRAEIARFVTNGKGEVAVLHSDRHWTPTTTGHQSAAWHASSQHRRFCVHDLTGESLTLCNDYAERYRKTLQKLTRATAHRAMYLGDLDFLRVEASAYATFFGYDFPADLFPKLDAATKEQIKAAQTRYDAAMAERNRTRTEREALKQHDNIMKWLAGEHVSIIGVEKTYLRVRGDEVETSKGALFPVTDAVKVWPYLKECVSVGMELTPHIKVLRLGHYTIDQVEKDGTVHARCHVVGWDEISRIAGLLGLV